MSNIKYRFLEEGAQTIKFYQKYLPLILLKYY